MNIKTLVIVLILYIISLSATSILNIFNEDFRIHLNEHLKWIYLPLICTLIVIMDIGTPREFFTSMSYKNFVMTTIIILAIVIYFSGTYEIDNSKEFQELENQYTGALNNFNYRPLMILVAISSIVVAVKLIPSRAPISENDINGYMDLIPLVVIQSILGLSLLRLKNLILSKCKEKINNYETHRLYYSLLATKISIKGHSHGNKRPINTNRHQHHIQQRVINENNRIYHIHLF